MYYIYLTKVGEDIPYPVKKKHGLELKFLRKRRVLKMFVCVD